jgi:hypothetical protein
MSECFHMFNEKIRNYAICKNCNVLLIVRDCRIVPILRKDELFSELNPFDVFKNMGEASLGSLLSERFISARKTLLEFLKSLCKRYHLKRQTLHLAIFLLDKLSLNDLLMRECELELLTIGCFILAGKNY